jgi:hypothetical protein
LPLFNPNWKHGSKTLINVLDIVQIHAARPTVWQNFRAIESWPQWNQEVMHARWITGEPWSDGAIFHITHKTLFGLSKETSYIVRMCVPGRSAIYESTAHFPVSTLCSVQLSDSLGGCQLEARHNYSGPAAPLLYLLLGRQKAKLHQAMSALKAHIERPVR